MTQDNDRLADAAAVAELDALGSTLKDGAALSDIIDIVGVVSGVKPCAFIQKATVGTDLITWLGLVYDISGKDHLVYISKSKQDAAKLASLHVQVWGKGNAYPDEHREIGKLLGYPETATEYYLKRLPTVGTPDELEAVEVPGVEHTVREFFHQIVLSPEHYQDEWALYCDPLEQAVQTLTPRTYGALKRLAAKERRKAMWSGFTRRFGL